MGEGGRDSRVSAGGGRVNASDPVAHAPPPIATRASRQNDDERTVARARMGPAGSMVGLGGDEVVELEALLESEVEHVREVTVEVVLAHLEAADGHLRRGKVR